MNILAIDTSSSWGSVAIAKEGRICHISYLDIRVTHSERLMLQIDNGLSQSGINLDDIDLIVFSNGPGSFTGLRIGLATVKGICTVKKIPLYPLSSLKALAYNAYGCAVNIAAFIDARMNEAYAALYDRQMNEVIAPMNTDPQAFIDSINEKSLIIGDGVYKYSSLIEKRNDVLTQGLIHQNYIIASSLIAAAIDDNIDIEFDFDAIADLEPYYLRKSQAEQNLALKNK